MPAEAPVGGDGVGGHPCGQQPGAVVGGVGGDLGEQGAPGAGPARVRAYGELVDLQGADEEFPYARPAELRGDLSVAAVAGNALG